MRTKILYLFIVILFIGCSKDNELTEIKNNGYGGISCKVNGIVVKPKGGGIYTNLDCRISQDGNGPVLFSISYFNDGNKVFKSIRIIAINIDYENMSGQTYSLQSEQNSESYANYEEITYLDNLLFNNNLFKTNSIQNGELKILFHDKQKNIITGTFWFDSINDKNEIIKVTEGRFDTFIN